MRMSEILGHAAAKATLKSALGRDRVHHAYLFAGPEGVGKRHLAYAFIARVLCTSPVDDDACGSCRHCRRVLEVAAWYDERGPFEAKDDAPELTPRHPDVLTLVTHGKQIKIDQVRAVLRIVPFRPVEAPCRFVVIDEAHDVNDAAANALLKTLEEPPAMTRFILISSRPANLLATIRSRCQRLGFGRLADGDIAAIIARRGGAGDVAQVTALAEGSARLAIELTEDPLIEAWAPLARRLLAVTEPPAIHGLARALADLPRRDAVFNRVARLMRDALLLRVGAGAPLFHEELRSELDAWAVAHPAESILHRLDLIEDTRINTATFNLRPQLAFERLLLAICAPAGAELSRPLYVRRDVM